MIRSALALTPASIAGVVAYYSLPLTGFTPIQSSATAVLIAVICLLGAVTGIAVGRGAFQASRAELVAVTWGAVAMAMLSAPAVALHPTFWGVILTSVGVGAFISQGTRRYESRRLAGLRLVAA